MYKKNYIILFVIILCLCIGIGYAYLETDLKLRAGISLKEKNPRLVDKIETLVKSDTTNLVYDGTVDNNLRYVGKSPSNYVLFNGEKWRIIGVMNNIDDGTGKRESRVKLISNSIINGALSWDSSDSKYNGGWGINEWSQADLMTELNEGPYWNRTSGSCYNSWGNRSDTCDFSSTGLTDSAKELIDYAVWHTGADETGTWKSSDDVGNTTSLYSIERGTGSGKTCSGGTCNDNVVRNSTWTGKVGLIYPSDYGFATTGGSSDGRSKCLTKSLGAWDSDGYSICKDNDWMLYGYFWTIMPSVNSSNGSMVSIINGGNGKLYDTYAYFQAAVRPSVYLKSSVLVSGGTGTSSDPYTIRLDSDYQSDFNKSLLSCKGSAASCLKESSALSSDLAVDDTADNNLRYIGKVPKNYVKFNDELWRIIGVMNNIDDGTGKKESRVKLVRANAISAFYPWDTSLGECKYDASSKSSTCTGVNGGLGVNEWSQADLMKLLNPGYENNTDTVNEYDRTAKSNVSSTMLVNNSLYWNRSKGRCFSNSNNSIYDLSYGCDFTKEGLTDASKNMIGKAVWYTGANSADIASSGSGSSYIAYKGGNTSEYYSWERSNNTGKACSSGNYCNDTVERTTKWTGYVGLPNTSDIGYATDGGSIGRETCLKEKVDGDNDWSSDGACFVNDWINNIDSYFFLLNPSYTYEGYSYYVMVGGSSFSIGFGGASNSFSLVPSVYLKSSIKITGGAGTSDNPYILS